MADGKARRLTIIAFSLFSLLLGACSSVKDTSRSFTKVVVDAGHGGHDNGATTRYGGREKSLALDVARRIVPKLQAMGFETLMTRDDDRFIPLDTRAQISNSQSNVIFVSIHFNYSPKSWANGAEVYYNSRCSIGIARNILNQVCAIPGVASRGVRSANFRVLKRARYPAVLVECGFLTNKGEGRRCAGSSHREALAKAIAQGIWEQKH